MLTEKELNELEVVLDDNWGERKRLCKKLVVLQHDFEDNSICAICGFNKDYR